MRDDWDELRVHFSRLVGRLGVEKVAHDLPADRKTVYRLLKGETQHPTLAIRAGVRRLLEAEKQREQE